MRLTLNKSPIQNTALIQQRLNEIQANPSSEESIIILEPPSGENEILLQMPTSGPAFAGYFKREQSIRFESYEDVQIRVYRTGEGDVLNPLFALQNLAKLTFANLIIHHNENTCPRMMGKLLDIIPEEFNGITYYGYHLAPLYYDIPIVSDLYCGSITSVDPDTMKPYYGAEDHYAGLNRSQPSRITPQGIIVYTNRLVSMLQPGDYAAVRFGKVHGGATIYSGANQHTLLDNVTIENAPGSVLFGDGSNNLTVRNCKFDTSKEDLFATQSDCLHWDNPASTSQINISNCSTNAHTGDDFVNVHGTTLKVVSVDGREVTLKRANGGGIVGRHLINPGHDILFFGQADSNLSLRTQVRSSVRDRTRNALVIHIDKELPVDQTIFAHRVDRVGKSVRLLNNNIKARARFYKDGCDQHTTTIIQNNIIESTGPAIFCGAKIAQFDELIIADDLEQNKGVIEVIGNTFVNCNTSLAAQAGVIGAQATDDQYQRYEYPLFRAINVVSNTFKNCGRYIIDAQNFQLVNEDNNEVIDQEYPAIRSAYSDITETTLPVVPGITDFAYDEQTQELIEFSNMIAGRNPSPAELVLARNTLGPLPDNKARIDAYKDAVLNSKEIFERWLESLTRYQRRYPIPETEVLRMTIIRCIKDQDVPVYQDLLDRNEE